jgi:hypothetical protein
VCTSVCVSVSSSKTVAEYTVCVRMCVSVSSSKTVAESQEANASQQISHRLSSIYATIYTHYPSCFIQIISPDLTF